MVMLRPFAADFALHGPVMACVLFQIHAVRDVVTVVVAGKCETVRVTGKGAVQFGVHATEDTLVADAAAETAVLGHIVFPFHTDFSPVGVVAGAVDALGEGTAAFFCVRTLVGVGIG